MLRLGVMTIAQGIGFARARPTDRVVIFDRAGRDRHHRIALVRQQHRAGPEEQVALHGDRILRRIALGIVSSGIDQEVDRLIALDIDDPQHLALGDMVQPRRAGGDDLVVDDGAGKAGEGRVAGHVLVPVGGVSGGSGPRC